MVDHRNDASGSEIDEVEHELLRRLCLDAHSGVSVQRVWGFRTPGVGVVSEAA